MTLGVHRGWSRALGLVSQAFRPLKGQRHRIDRISSLAFISCIVLGGLATIVLLLLPPDYTFSVTATTETATIVVDDRLGVAVRLPLARLSSRPDEDFPLASLEVADRAWITLARKREGDLLARVEWGRDVKDGARLVTQDGSLVALSSGDNLRIALERTSSPRANGRIPDTVTLAFHGTLRIGEDVGPLVSHTLLSARVLIVERQPILRHRFVVGEALLDPGDVPGWRTRHGTVATVSGFVHVGAGPALQVTAHGTAHHLAVDRFGAASYEIRPPEWSRIAHDPILSSLAIAATALVALLTIYDLGVRRVQERRERKAMSQVEARS